MGCCQSRRRKQVTEDEFLPSIVNVKSLQSSNESSACKQTFVSSAGWVADSSHGDFIELHLDGPRLFVCLFDPHTSHEAATFCVAQAHNIFLSSLIATKSDPKQALELTFTKLEQEFLNSDLPAEVRAMSGCSGVLVYIDFSQEIAWIGNVGTSQCVMGISEGAFNARNTVAKMLSNMHSAQNPTEQEEMNGRFPTDEELFESIDGYPYLKGITRLVRCIGYGFAKDPQLADLYNKTAKKRVVPVPDVKNPYILCKPEVMEVELSESSENLVLYSEGMSQLLSPSEISIYTSVFDKKCLAQLTDIFHGYGSDTIKASLRNDMESLKYPSSALIRFAVSKAADEIDSFVKSFKKPKHQDQGGNPGSRDRWNVEHVRSLGVKDPQKFNQQSDPENPLISRGDLMRNLSCVVISLNRTSTRGSPSLTLNVHSKQARVQYGWKLLQSYCKFHILRRRACLRRWWTLIAAVVRDTQRKMLEAEKDRWLKEEMHMIHQHGQYSTSFDDHTPAANQYASFPCKMSSKFKKWLSSPGFHGAEPVDENRFSLNKGLVL